MATIYTTPVSAPPMPAVSRILAQFDRVKVEAFIEIAIGLLDTFDRAEDPDTPDFSPRSDALPGDPGDHEPAGDAEAGAYAEWTSLLPQQRRAPACLFNSGGHEDDELDGDESDGNGAEDEECAWFKSRGHGPGCIISDSDRGDTDIGAV